MNKDVRELVRDLRKIPDVSVEKGRGGHYKVKYQDRVVGGLSTSPSDRNWKRNALAELRRNGLVMDGAERAKAAAPENGGDMGVPKGTTLPHGHVPENLHQDALQAVNKIWSEVGILHDLKARKGRTVPHGATPKLAKVLYEYSQASGIEVPHLNYTEHFDPSDMREMARLAANNLGTIAAYPKRGITQAAYDKAMYARDAWHWHTMPAMREAEEADPLVSFVEVEQSYVSDAPKTLVEEWPLPLPQVEEPEEVFPPQEPTLVGDQVKEYIETWSSPSNGDDDLLVLALVAKLAAHGVGEDEAASMGLAVLNAIRK